MISEKNYTHCQIYTANGEKENIHLRKKRKKKFFKEKQRSVLPIIRSCFGII